LVKKKYHGGEQVATAYLPILSGNIRF